MTEPALDLALDPLVLDYAERGVRPFDSREIAEALVSRRSRYRPFPSMPSVGRRWFIPLLVGLLIVLLTTGVVLVGASLLRSVTQSPTFPQLSVQPVGQPAVMRDEFVPVPLADGTVLLLGGSSTDGMAAGVAELFDPRFNSFRIGGSLMVPRRSFAAVRLHDGGVLIAGGTPSVPPEPLTTAELYDPATGSFRFTGSMNGPVASPRLVLLRDGRVLVVDSRSATPAEIYDPARGVFSTLDRLFDGATTGLLSSLHPVLLDDGSVFIANARAGTNGSQFVLFDPSTGDVRAGPAIVVPDRALQVIRDAIALKDGSVLVMAELRGAGPPIVHEIGLMAVSPSTGSVRDIARYSESVSHPTMVMPPMVQLADGRVLMHRVDPSGDCPISLVVVDPADGTTVDLPTVDGMSSACVDPGIAALDDGGALVVGLGGVPSVPVAARVVVSEASP